MKAFLALGLAAGALNYLFQVLASRALPLAEFADYGAWFARVSMLLAPAVALQYAANFLPLRGRALKINVVALNLLLLALAVAWPLTAGELGTARGAMVVSAAAIFGWLAGQAQIALRLRTLAFAGFTLGAAKCAGVWFIARASAASFASPVFYSYLPGAWLLGAALWRDSARAEAPAARPGMGTGARLGAILVLSVAATCFPQIDLAVLRLTLGPGDFARFALASLFYKAIYFIALAWLQWTFPQQVRGRLARPPAREVARWGLMALAASGALALAGPPLAGALLGWAERPPASWVFLGSVNIALLTWIYVGVQAECAAGRTLAAARQVGLVALEAALQLGLGLEVLPYLILATACQFALAARPKGRSRRGRL